MSAVKPPKSSQAVALAQFAEVAGLLMVAGGVAAVRWWLGLIVLGVGFIAIGIAEELA